MWTWWKVPFAARVALLAVLITVTNPGRAAIVSYDWVPQPGSAGAGFLTLDSPLIADPSNFSGVGFAALSALNYTFGNGASIQKGDIQFFQGFPFSAAGGQLTNSFQFSTNTVALSFSLASNAGISSNQIVTPGPAITDAGNWRLAAAPAAVPLPAALPLFASGILAVFGWRSPRLIGRNRRSTSG
jgi:hypothetical protein